MSDENQRGAPADGLTRGQLAPEHRPAELIAVGSGGRPVTLQEALDLHLVNLLRLKETLGVAAVDTAAKKELKQVLIDMTTITETRQDIDGLRE